LGNSLRIDWETVVESKKLNFILGNPPFIGKQYQTDEQKSDLEPVFASVKGAGVLDYVAAWHIKATRYIQGTKIKVAFVSTNSICQGEQAGVLWRHLFEKGIKIHFAHRTFKWSNEAKGNAQVHCVIIGFAAFNGTSKALFNYETPVSEPVRIETQFINSYLIPFDDVVVESRRKPLCNVPEIVFGNMPNDGGNLLFTDEEKIDFLKKEPGPARLSNNFYRHASLSTVKRDGAFGWTMCRPTNGETLKRFTKEWNGFGNIESTVHGRQPDYWHLLPSCLLKYGNRQIVLF
jgi:hypothetical protein